MLECSKCFKFYISLNLHNKIKGKYVNLSLLFSLILFILVIFSPRYVYASNTLPRLSGSDRYETAISISKSGWDKSDNVVLATGNDFPDALSASPLAKELDAPILLTDKESSLSEKLKAELDRLQAKNIYIIGGEGVISNNLDNELQQRNFKVIRISGADRSETSLKIASYLSNNFNIADQVIISTGNDFPDALSVAPIAASKGIPIILSPKDMLPANIKEFLQDNTIEKTYVIGGIGVISDTVFQQLPGAERLWGIDRYATNIAIINKFSNDINYSTTYVATGIDFPDALAGASLAAKTLSPIILASQYGIGISGNTSYNNKINSVQPLGGEGALAPSVLQRIIYAVDYDVDYELGNSPGNSANQGYAAEQGDYVYYYQLTGTPSTGAIYKMKKDGTGKIKLCDNGSNYYSPAPYINVVGDWVYYRYNKPVKVIINDNTSDPTPKEVMTDVGSIYKIRTDGTQNTKITDDNALGITVIDKWIYYYTGKYGNDLDQVNQLGIYKIKIDGSQKVKLIDSASHIKNIADRYIFYYDHGNVYRMNLDGSGKIQIPGGDFMVYGTRDWLYYIIGDFATSSQIYKTRLDGSEMTILYSGDAIGNKLNVNGEYVYFSNNIKVNINNNTDIGIPGTFRVKNDGTGLTKICADPARNISIIGDYIYYSFYNANYIMSQTYRINVDGSNRKILES